MWIFPIAKYKATLQQVLSRKQIDTRFQHDLKALHPDKKEAVFTHMDTGEEITMSYDMIHVTPHMSAPDFLKQSPISNEDGWVDVDKDTLQHSQFSNIFALGDCSSLPTSKTGAAIRKQAPTLVENLLSVMQGNTAQHVYEGSISRDQWA